MALNRFIETVMPKELKEIVTSSFTLSRIGNIFHYQGGDACLEEINKEAKAWIKQVGVPSDNEWVKIFRNLDKMNEVISYLIKTIYPITSKDKPLTVCYFFIGTG